MLDTLRKSTGSWVVKILFGLLILSFGVWGIGDVIRGGAASAPAIKVGDVEIGPGYIRQQFQRQVERLRQVFGPDLTMETARQMGLLEQTIGSVVTQATLDMAARDMGVVVSEEALREAVVEEPAFQTQQGTFDRDLFLRVLAANNMTEEEYLASLRNDVRRARIVQAVVASSAAPEALVDPLFRFRQERRIAETLTVNAEALTLDEQPTEDELRALYEENIDRYTAPQYRAVTAVLLSPEDMKDRVGVSDEDIADYYAANRGQFTTPETRSVSQIIVSDAEIATAVAEAAQEGKTLAEAASAAGAPAPIDLGSVTRQGLPPEAADVVFALDAGAVSEPVESPLGWHVFQVDEIVPRTEKPLEAVRDEIRDRIASERAIDVLYEESAALEDALGGGATLEEAAKQLDLPLYTVEAVDIDGRTPTGTPADLPENRREAILQTAFGLEEGQESLLEETQDGYFVVRVDDVIPAAPRPFEDVRDQVRAQWEAERRQERAQTLAEKLVERARGPVQLASLAEGNPAVSYAKRPAVTRQGETRGEGQAVPPALVEPLFGLEPGEVTWAPTEEGATVIRLSEVVPAVPSEETQAVETLTAEVRSAMAEDVLQQMTAAFGNRFEVEVNRQVIETAF